MMLIKQLKIQRKQFSATITFQIKTKIMSFSLSYPYPSIYQCGYVNYLQRRKLKEN